MNHYPEAHLSTLSHAIMRMSKDDISAVLKERDKVIMKVRYASCLKDKIDADKWRVE